MSPLTLHDRLVLRRARLALLWLEAKEAYATDKTIAIAMLISGLSGLAWAVLWGGPV